MAAPRPPRPAPTMMTYEDLIDADFDTTWGCLHGAYSMRLAVVAGLLEACLEP
jgi:hypothetical protein